LCLQDNENKHNHSYKRGDDRRGSVHSDQRAPIHILFATAKWKIKFRESTPPQ